MKARLLPILRALTYVCAAILACSVVFAFAGYSSVALLANIVQGALLSHHGVLHTLRWSIPLFVTALGVIVTFRCGYFNIGAQGQFYLGAIGASFVADRAAGLPPPLTIVLCVAAGSVAGAMWALWPAVLRLRSGTDEVITTLMGNFIAGFVLLWVTGGILKDTSGSGQSSAGRPVAAALRIATSSGVSWTLVVLAALCGLAVWVLMERTAFGVLGTLAGRNPVMTQWQGAPALRLGFLAFAVGGGLAGIAGALEVLGPSGRIVSGFVPGLGFSAILVALVAGLAVPAAAVAALFFGGLAAASLYLPVIAGLPAAAIDLINAAITLVITARAWPRLPARRARTAAP